LKSGINVLHCGMKTILKYDLNENFEKIRIMRGYTRRSLSKACNINEKTIRLFERGERDMGYKNLIKMCEVLKVDLKIIL